MVFFRSHVANENHVSEALRLFNNSTMDAARSGITPHINLSPEMANEIKVRACTSDNQSGQVFCSCNFLDSSFVIIMFNEQQAETQIKRRMGIGSHISERRLIDDLTRMGLNESIVRPPISFFLKQTM